MIVHTVKVGKKVSIDNKNRDHKKIYVGCAEADARYKEMLVYGRHRWELYTKPTIEFLTFDRNEDLEVAECKTLIEERMSKADGVMIIVTPNTIKDPLASLELDYAITNNIPVVGIDIDKNSKEKKPDQLEGKMTTYGWEWFAEFINGL